MARQKRSNAGGKQHEPETHPHKNQRSTRSAPRQNKPPSKKSRVKTRTASNTSKNTMACAECGGTIHKYAIECRHCGYLIPENQLNKAHAKKKKSSTNEFVIRCCKHCKEHISGWTDNCPFCGTSITRDSLEYITYRQQQAARAQKEALGRLAVGIPIFFIALILILGLVGIFVVPKNESTIPLASESNDPESAEPPRLKEAWKTSQEHRDQTYDNLTSGSGETKISQNTEAPDLERLLKNNGFDNPTVTEGVKESTSSGYIVKCEVIDSSGFDYFVKLHVDSAFTTGTVISKKQGSPW